jgi:hypothetical protein
VGLSLLVPGGLGVYDNGVLPGCRMALPRTSGHGVLGLQLAVEAIEFLDADVFNVVLENFGKDGDHPRHELPRSRAGDRSWVRRLQRSSGRPPTGDVR